MSVQTKNNNLGLFNNMKLKLANPTPIETNKKKTNYTENIKDIYKC